jgi:hypothetical protein
VYSLVWETNVNGKLKIRHERAVLEMEALREHGAVSVIL